MEIIIEDQVVDVDLPKENVQLGEIIQEVEGFLFEIGQIPTGLAIDGHDLTQAELESRQRDILSGRESLKFTVINALDFVQENLNGVESANKELLKNLTAFSEEIYKSEKSVEPDVILSELGHFFDFWAKLELLLKSFVDKVEVEGKKFGDLFTEMRAILEEARQAMETGDFVLGADLIQYELVPSIELVAKGIPLLKELLEEAEQ